MTSSTNQYVLERRSGKCRVGIRGSVKTEWQALILDYGPSEGLAISLCCAGLAMSWFPLLGCVEEAPISKSMAIKIVNGSINVL